MATSTTEPNAASCKLYEHKGPDRVWYHVSNRHVTDALRKAAAHAQKTTGISPVLISVRSMRLGGAMALLCTGIDADAIKLVGRWKSDSMLLCLWAQVVVIGQRYAQQMLDNGSCAFTPLVLERDHLTLPINVSQDVQDVQALFGPKQ